MSKINIHVASIKALIGFTLLALVAGTGFFYHASHAYADGTFCQLSSGDPCKEVFAVGSGNQPIARTQYGPGMTTIQSVLRAYAFSGVDSRENDTYMLFHLTVTLSPDLNSNFQNWLIPNGLSADSSQAGDKATLHARLWSANARFNDCAMNTPCSQQNYPGLEVNNYCYQNGGSQTFGISQNLGAKDSPTGVNWSVAAPTYNWCILTPSSDIYSQYYDYTLQDENEVHAQITQDFVFAQWQSNITHDFKIGYSVQSHLGQVARTHSSLYVGPSVGDASIVYPT